MFVCVCVLEVWPVNSVVMSSRSVNPTGTVPGQV